MTPNVPAPYSCGAMDATSQALMADVNRFWGSEIQLCACGPDYPSYPDCQGAVAHAGGWVFASQLHATSARSGGSDMPASYLFAHEVAHEIQSYYNVLPSREQPKELMADCLAGYYLGSLACRGLVTAADIRATLETACFIADGTGDPIADIDTHGTCEQRAASVAIGMDAYLTGRPPLDACSL